MVGHSSKHLGHEEVEQDTSLHQVAFPESDLDSLARTGDVTAAVQVFTWLVPLYPSEDDLPLNVASQAPLSQPPCCTPVTGTCLLSLSSSETQGPERQASFPSAPFCLPLTK